MKAPTSGAFAAVDLGATSGRVMIGRVGRDWLSLELVMRFSNGGVRGADGSLRWPYSKLRDLVLTGLAEAQRREPMIGSIGIDSWAVDYGLLADGELLNEPYHYRDERNLGAADRVHKSISAARLYAMNGLQHLPFNTVFQLAAENRLTEADTILLIPDLLAFDLTGVAIAERTNASTTGLVGALSGDWDAVMLRELGISCELMPEIVEPGTLVGRLRPPMRDRVGGDLDVVAVASHDTASAVLAVPAEVDDFAYISCGTWGLVGLELDAPVLTDAARAANFTNEGGVDGTTRFLHNVMGLWLLSECVREWNAADPANPIDLPALIDQAAAVTAPAGLIDPNDELFLAPDGMEARILGRLAATGQLIPLSRAELVRAIIESLAQAFADAVRTAGELAGRGVSVIHLVGGGSQNTLLCQLTADRSGLPVLAGPVEATALGNVLIQARAAGLFGADRGAMRALVARTHPPRHYEPRVNKMKGA